MYSVAEPLQKATATLPEFAFVSEMTREQRKAENLRACADACVQGEKCNVGHCLARDKGAREVKGVQGSDRFIGEGSSSSLQNFCIEAKADPAGRSPVENGTAFVCIRFRDLSQHRGANQNPIALDQSQIRCDDDLSRSQRLPDLHARSFTQ